jgi:hypothetical protein
MTRITCEHCGAAFSRRPFHLAQAAHHFCSRACRIAAQRQPALEFWPLVAKTERGCWEWQGARNSAGYGVLKPHGRQRRAHRVAWELTYGPIPAGLIVCHACDTPACCNPAHLLLGTHGGNSTDKVAKHRQVHGERVNTAKLTRTQVAAIRARYAAGGLTLVQLAAEYGVSDSAIHFIIAGKTWRHLLQGEKR